MTAVLLVWLRYLLLGGAKSASWVRRAVYCGWRRPLVWLGMVAAATWFAVHPGPVGEGWWSLGGVVGIFMLVALARWIWDARTRLVIGNFIDYRGATPKPLPGLSSLLQVELGRLYDLVNLVDQNRAVPDVLKGRQSVYFDEDLSLDEAEEDPNLFVEHPLDVPAPMMVEDLTNVLDAALSVEAAMSVGPVKVPVGAIAALVGRLAQGPRLSGSVHQTEGGLVLTARTVGATRTRIWRVDTPPATGAARQDPEEPAEALVDELAVRIFTDLAMEGSVKWQATWAYVNGLRAYRGSLRTKKDRRLSLERAKEQFIETIAEDDRFDRAYYNLGVVATELSQKDAAESAFLAAIRLNNQRWAPYYGLAQLYFANGRYKEVLPLCGRILRLGQHRAEAYHVRALSHRRNRHVEAAMSDSKAAVASSWLGLCAAVFHRHESGVRQLAATSLRNLATMRAYDAKKRWPPQEFPDSEDNESRPLRLRIGYLAAAEELKQGILVNPSDAELHFELGKIQAARRKWGAAARALEAAVEIDPDRPRFWIQLARAYAGPTSERERKACEAKAIFASERAKARPSDIVDDGFERLQKVYGRLQRSQDLDRIRELQEFEVARKVWTAEDPSVAELEQKLAEFDSGSLWETTQVCVRLAECYLDQGDRDSASRVADHLTAKLGDLCREHPREVKDRQVYALVAEALRIAGRDTEALRYAEAAVVHDPLSTRARKALAELHTSLEHFEQATNAWRAALVCDPDGPETNLTLGETLMRHALRSAEPDRRRCMFAEAVTYLQSGLKLAELQGISRGGRNGVAEMTDVEGKARFWLGRAYVEQDAYEQAVTHLQLCIALDYEPVLARLRLGVAYLRMGHVSDGERVLADISRVAGTTLSSSENGSVIVGPSGDRMSVRDVLAWARIHAAGSRIDRDAGLEDAIKDIRRVATETRKECDGDTGLALLAACSDWEGWARFLLNEDELAIDKLQESIRLEPTAEAYLHLAQVYANHALDNTVPVARAREETRARHYSELARRMGLSAQQAQPLDDLIRRLDLEHVGHPPVGGHNGSTNEERLVTSGGSRRGSTKRQ